MESETSTTEQPEVISPARPFYALTLKQPWAWAICYKDKRIENRDWAPPRKIIGRHIAIHAGRGMDEDGFRWLHKRGLISVPFPPAAHVRGAIVAVATLDSVVTASEDPWFGGRYGWVLRDVVVLPSPVPCRGALGLWRLDEATQVEVLSQIDKESK